jgi:Uncharacterised protein family UPF0547
MTRSVFQKACPNCAAMVPLDTERCDCGYSFSVGTAPDSDDEDTPMSQDEELYVAYLGARVEQARSALESARTALVARPGDFGKAVAVMEAVHELRASREELTAEITRHPQAAARLPQDKGAASAQPSEEFRAEQAARATKIMESLQAAARHAPATQPAPTHDDTAGHDKPDSRR